VDRPDTNHAIELVDLRTTASDERRRQ
jgi:hypothetical protein